MPKSALQYLMAELKISAADWKVLAEKDKDDLKKWAMEEQFALGL